jgi:hypothetical protein
VNTQQAEELRQGRRIPAMHVVADGECGMAFLGDEPIAIVRREGTEAAVVRGFGPKPEAPAVDDA